MHTERDNECHYVATRVGLVLSGHSRRHAFLFYAMSVLFCLLMACQFLMLSQRFMDHEWLQSVTTLAGQENKLSASLAVDGMLGVTREAGARRD